ncbi:MAG: phospholipase D-like domain-containing protein, partial [Kiritimatiellaeota bacterium]|nr:phospholipase D-like domain-containing protein [Kiritimatiellota bacterium]
SRLVFRDHRKLLVCDTQVAVVGGFNIMDEQAGDGVTRGWRDLGLRLGGAVVADLAASFDAMWARAGHTPRRRWRLLERSGMGRAPRPPPVALLTSQPGRRSAIRRTLLSDFRQARELRIISAYFLPSRPMRRAMRRAARRGGDVQIVTAGKTDVPLARYAGRSLYDRLLRLRMRVFEYDAQVLHTKLIVSDNAVYIGSANLDNRSLTINHELLVRIEDPRLAGEARRIFDGYLPHCRAIDRGAWARARSIWEKGMEHLAYFLIAYLDAYLARRGLSKLR